MATSLQRQLAALKSPSTSILVPERRRASIIFTPSEAATYSRDTFYQIGLEGLKELHGINPLIFSPYFKSKLFDEAARDLERAVEDNDTNKLLDDLIEEFLISLSPFMTIKASLKCLEWLVYRFHIEKFNIEAVLRCILPYYDTKTFALVIKVLEINKFKEKYPHWSWLGPSVQTGLPVTKTTLHANTNARFVSWIFETLYKFISVHQKHPQNLGVYYAFFTSSLLGILNNVNQDKSNERLLFNGKTVVSSTWKGVQDLLTFIQKGSPTLQSDEDLHSAIYVVVAMLVIIIKESRNLCSTKLPVGAVTSLMLQTNPINLRRQGVLLLNLIASVTDRLGVTGKELVDRTLQSVAALSHEMDLSACAAVLLLNQVQDKNMKTNKVWRWLSLIQMTAGQRAQLLRDLYYAYKNHADKGERHLSKKFITQMERQYPVEFGLISKEDEQLTTDLVESLHKQHSAVLAQHADKNLRRDAVNTIFTRVKYRMNEGKKFNKKLEKQQQATKSDSGEKDKDKEKVEDMEVTIVEEKVETTAEIIGKKGKNSKKWKKKQKEKQNKNKTPTVVATKKKNSQKPKQVVKDTNQWAREIIQRFDDDCPQVVEAILKQKPKVLKYIFSHEKLVQGLSIIAKKRLNNKCTKLALKKLCLIASKLEATENELKPKILVQFIPFLFPIKESGIPHAKIILSSPFASKHLLLSKYKKVLKSPTLTPEEVCKFSFELIQSQQFELNSTHWLQEYEKDKSNKFLALLGLMTVTGSEEAKRVFEAFETVELDSNSDYPITSDNIFGQVKLAEKKKRISLDMFLTPLMNTDLKSDSEFMRRIFNYVLLLCEKERNRDACMYFFQKSFEKYFEKSGELLQFWMNMILANNKSSEDENEQSNNHKSEYLQIRTLQFLSYIFNKLAHTAANDGVDNKELSKLETIDETPKGSPKRTINTRKSVLINETLQSSPARCTRASIRAKIPSNEATPKVEPMDVEVTQVNEVKDRRKSAAAATKSQDPNPVNVNLYVKEASGLVEVLITQCVQHESDLIRHWGLKCLKILLEWKYLEPVWRNLIKYVLRFKKEIRADKKQLNVAIAKMLVDKTSLNIQDRFVAIATNEEKVEPIRFGILELCSNGSLAVFNKLGAHIRRLLKDDPLSKFLLAYLGTFDGSLEHIDIISESLKRTETAKKILSKLTATVFTNATLALKTKLFGIMISSVGCCESPELRVAIQRTVRKWTLDASIITAELETCLAVQRRRSGPSIDSNEGRNVSTRSTGAPTPVKPNNREDIDLSIDWVSRTEAVLEFAQSRKRLENRTNLINPLFKLLKICIQLEEQSPVEYLKQLILTSLTISCEQEDGSDYRSNSDDWIHFNVDSVIDCLRISRNPQTHHHALILLNYAASRYPEQVLHGVMSLFTFMGNSILRQDDAYSTQLIQQTVTTIIPTLATAGTVPTYNRSLVSAGIYRVFTSAVQDIPVHRRIPVFTSLVEVLNPLESMWQVCLIIVDNVLTKDKKRSTLNADIELATNLLWNFEPSVILETLKKVYMYITALPIYEKKSNEDFSKCKTRQDALSKAVVDLSRKQSLRDVQLVILFTLELVSKVASKFTTLEGNQKLNYDQLLEKCLSYSRLLAGVNDDRIFRWAANRNFEVIERINAALEPEEFVQVVRLILTRDDLNIKKKIMDIFNQRILQKLDWFGDPKLLLSLIPSLLSVGQVKEEADEEEEGEVELPEETVTLIQTAFLSLKLIARNLASQYPEEFIPVFDLCYTHARSKNRLLCSSALLCLSELFCLKSLILPKLTEISKAISRAFKNASKIRAEVNNTNSDVDDDEDDGEDKMYTVKKGKEDSSIVKEEESLSVTANLLLVSGMTCLNKLVEQLGTFVNSTFLTKSLVSVLLVDSRFGRGEKAENRKKAFEHKLKILMKTISLKIPLRNSLSSIRKAFAKLLGKGNQSSIIILLRLLRESLTAMDKSEFSILLPALCDSYLDEFLTFREQVGQVGVSSEEEEQEKTVSVIQYSADCDREEVDAVEDSILDSLVTGIVLKISEGTFRPFYHRIFDWAGDNLIRRVTFYRLSFIAAERLKSLFVTFAGHVIGQAAESLHENVELTRAILKYFYQIFSHDREGFVTTDRFNSLIKPLVDLIETDFVTSNAITIKELNDTIVQLAVATNDLNRWQYLIELISYKSQNEDSRVRLFVVSTLDAIANELEKDFLPLLPPAVPFLAELLADDDEFVEAETKKMLLKIENIVGEPLQPYFNN